MAYSEYMNFISSIFCDRVFDIIVQIVSQHGPWQSEKQNCWVSDKKT